MLKDYFVVLVFLLIATVMALAPLVLGYLVGQRKPDKEKLSTYECGFEPFDDARTPFAVKFYLVAILFIIFDLETAFFFPWAIVLRKENPMVLWSMLSFLFILVVGFIYEWRKGALEWE